MNQRQQRQAWTKFVDGDSAASSSTESKYANQRCGKYASKHEADVATKLRALEGGGKIFELKEQVRIVLVAADDGGRDITYIADFTYYDQDGIYHVLDAKGFKTAVYKLKKRLARLLHKIQIEEV